MIHSEFEAPFVCLPIDALPVDVNWLLSMPVPVIAVGNGVSANADVVVSGGAEIKRILANIERAPTAALALVQVLRITEHLPISAAMTVESLAYGTLQAGEMHQRWLASRGLSPCEIRGEGEPILITREGGCLRAEINRGSNRNALTVELRDALIELFELVLHDDSIEQLHISGHGRCFGIGGDLREFGLNTDPALAHWIRSVHNPSRLLASCADRVSVHLHGACLGSGIELSAFAHWLSADATTYFQLPEMRLGLIPGAGGCVSIARRIGRHRTAWMVLSGKKINAETALEWGLIDEIIPADSALAESAGMRAEESK